MVSNSIGLSILTLVLPLVSFFILIASSEKFTFRLVKGISVLYIVMIIAALQIISANWDGSQQASYTWFHLAETEINIGISLNRWVGIMLFIVVIISLLVNIFSLEYMKHDKAKTRYFGTLSLFTFAMLGIVLFDSLFVIFIFWELVGFCSYLLIGHWYHKGSASNASKKAFLVNRIGDIGFLVALGICWFHFETFSISEIYTLTLSANVDLALLNPESSQFTILGLVLFLAAIGKSAQFPLQVWLPDAMEGPTPISALIHAATMVAAGVYLLFRVYFLLNLNALIVVGTIGALTAFMGAVAALRQNDIKKVLAYSTISQLGYMVVGLGVGSYQAAMFHLFTHAFFKAGLFLGAGAIIHYLHEANHQNEYNAQDMKLMGGLRKQLPVTFYTYFIFSLSLIGVPLFSGFLSKDAILLSAFNSAQSMGGIYYLIAVFAFGSVALTSFYVFRQLYLVFFGQYRGENRSLIKENSLLMKGILTVLAVLSLGIFWSKNPVSIKMVWLLDDISQEPTNTSYPEGYLVPIISVLLIIVGFLIAKRQYASKDINKKIQDGLLENDTIAKRVSSENWFLDSIYQRIIISPLMVLAGLIKAIENRVIDKIVNLAGWFTVIFAHITAWLDRAFVDGIITSSAYVVGRAGLLTKSIQGSRVQSYIIWTVMALLIILLLAL